MGFTKLPLFGVRQGWAKLVQRVYTNEVTQTIAKVKTPIDMYILIINLLAKFPGLDNFRINRNNGYIMTWDEMNEVWMEGLQNLKKIPTKLVNF